METSRAEQLKSEAQPPFTDHQPPFLPDSNEETTFNLRAALDSWIGLVLRDKPTQQLPRGGQDRTQTCLTITVSEDAVPACSCDLQTLAEAAALPD